MTLLLFYLFLAVGVSFFCSISEAILLSVRPSYVAALNGDEDSGGQDSGKGGAGARTLKALRENLDRPLAAILTANTIAHTVGAAGVGAQSAVVFGNAYVGVTSAVLTFIILVFSEIIPKTLGARYWPQLAPSFAILIEGLTRLLGPAVWMSEKLTRMIAPASASVFTYSRDEMQAMAEIGAKEGTLETKELHIVRNLLRLNELSVRDVMTPRPVIFSVPASMKVQEFFMAHAKQPFSRIPLYADTTDDVTGYVLKSDLFVAQAQDEFDKPLSAFERQFLSVSVGLSASELFDLLMHERAHIALVVDEYGTIKGLVTLEDVVETLIGLEITDESDRVEDMQALAHKRWRERMTALGIDADSVALDRQSAQPQAPAEPSGNRGDNGDRD